MRSFTPFISLNNATSISQIYFFLKIYFSCFHNKTKKHPKRGIENRDLSMAWIEVAKANDSIDCGWLSEMFTLRRFPIWFAKVMEMLANSWNTRILAQTTRSKEISPTIHFKKGLPQGDALCPICSCCA